MAENNKTIQDKLNELKQLRKSIYEVSGKSYSREVKPDTSPLEQGQTTSNFNDKNYHFLAFIVVCVDFMCTFAPA